MLYDMTTRPEYEANIVVAEILIDNEELLDYIYTYRYSAEQNRQGDGYGYQPGCLKNSAPGGTRIRFAACES